MYPITLTSDWRAVVIGGGAVGKRKIDGLLNANIYPRLVSPQATRSLQARAAAGQIDWLQRPYQPGDLSGFQMAFAATNQRDVNAQVAAESQARGILCNIADAPDTGNFHVPAVHRGTDVMITVSTYGHDPGRARAIRDRIARFLEEEA